MRKELSVLILVILAVFLFIMAAGFTFGSPLETDMDDYFIRNGQEQIATNNISPRSSLTTVVSIRWENRPCSSRQSLVWH